MRLASTIQPTWPSSGTERPASRARTGRLPLPRHVAELTLDDEPALAFVNAFADQLVDLPLSTWLAIGATIAADRDGLPVRRDAWDTVDAAIVDHGLAIAAWYVRDTIETAAFLVSRNTSQWSSRERRVFASAQASAESAALALLARDHLSGDVLSTVFAPFVGSPTLPDNC